MAELAGGVVARGVIDVYPRKRRPVRVRLRMARVKRVLGVAPPAAQARRILAGLGLGVRARGADLDVTVPSFRRDLSIEDDLVEEIIRVWGYDRIPSTLPGGAISLVTHPAALRQGQTVRRALVGAGLAEGGTDAVTGPARAELLRRSVDPEPVDVYDAKGLAEHTLDALAVRASTGEAGVLSGFEPDCHGTLVAESGAIVAEFGEVAAALRESFGIPTPVFAAVVSLDAVGAAVAAPMRYQALPRFPAVERDLAFVIGGDQTAARI